LASKVPPDGEVDRGQAEQKRPKQKRKERQAPACVDNEGRVEKMSGKGGGGGGKTRRKRFLTSPLFMGGLLEPAKGKEKG